MKRGRTKRLMKRAGKSSLALLPGLVYSWVFFVVPLLILFRYIKACETVCLLVDSSKYKCGGIAIAASPEMVDYLFTDSGIPDEALKSFSAHGVHVICCNEK